MDKLDIIADITLRDLAKKEKLRETIHQPAYKYYLKGGVIRVLFSLCGILFFLCLLIKYDIPSWKFMVIGLASIAFLESMRNMNRVNALVALHEVENLKKG